MKIRSPDFISAILLVPPIIFFIGAPDELSYFFIGLICLLYLALLLTRINAELSAIRYIIIFISFIIPTMWVIASLNGVINGADASNALRNFFGMNLFIIMILIYASSPTLKTIESAIFLSNFAVFSALLIALRDFSLSSYLISLADKDFRLTYSAAGIISVPTISICVYRLFEPKDFYFRSNYLYILQLLIALTTAFIIFSKGVFLTIFLVVSIHLISVLPYTLNMKITYKRLFFLGLYFGFLMAILLSPILDTLVFLYSNREGSNSVRSEQFWYLINELSFGGAGLGTELKSGYKRDELGYGFELTLLNLIQKMGILALAYFSIIITCILTSTYKIFRRNNILPPLLSLSCMLASLVSGSFNPLLFAPFSVILQLIGIYLALQDTNKIQKCMLAIK